MDDINIKKSKIEGLGVFANRDFRKGDVVLIWKPEVITKEQSEALPEARRRYIFGSNGRYYLMQIPERYVNHSCDANTRVENNCDVAIRDIKEGEEITSDYGKNNPDSFLCKCGSKNCRSAIK